MIAAFLKCQQHEGKFPINEVCTVQPIFATEANRSGQKYPKMKLMNAWLRVSPPENQRLEPKKRRVTPWKMILGGGVEDDSFPKY